MRRLRFKTAIALLAIFTGAAVTQEPVPTKLLVLGESFSNLPVLWEQEEPFAPVGKWMSALRLQWVVKDDGIAMKAPGNISFFWSKNAATSHRQRSHRRGYAFATAGRRIFCSAHQPRQNPWVDGGCQP